MMVKSRSQQEIDEMWGKLSAGGQENPCGWLKDKYGLSWQIVGPAWDEMFRDAHPEKSERVMAAILHAAILQMGKPDMQQVQNAYDGR